MRSIASTSLSVRADAMKRDASFAFERNIGQTDPQVKFLARAGDYTLFLTPAGPTLALRGGQQRCLANVTGWRERVPHNRRHRHA
jgi:hypothetical protein